MFRALDGINNIISLGDIHFETLLLEVARVFIEKPSQFRREALTHDIAITNIWNISERLYIRS